MKKEYIEREKVVEVIKNFAKGAIEDGQSTLDPVDVSFLLVKAVEYIPAADVAEVVRCAKCKHLKIINNGRVFAKCLVTDFEFLPFGTDTRTHYCGFGERKD